MAGRIRDADIALVRERSPISRGRGRLRAAASRRGGAAEGPVPVPRGEDPVVFDQPVGWPLPLLRVRGRRRRDPFPPGHREPDVRGGCRAAGGAGRRRADVRRRPRRRARRGEPPAAAHRRARRGGPLLRGLPRQRRGPAGPPLPARARLRPGGGAAVRRGLRTLRLGCAHQAPAEPALRRRRPGGGRARQVQQPRHPHRPVPAQGALAGPGARRRGRRLRRPPALRRRPGAEVPQHAGNPDLSQGEPALRRRPGAPRHRRALPGRRRGGLHRCDGLPSRRCVHGRGDVRDVVRARAHRRAAPPAARPGRVPQRGHLPVRRGRGRACRGAAGVQRRSALRRADVRRGRAVRPGSV